MNAPSAEGWLQVQLLPGLLNLIIEDHEAKSTLVPSKSGLTREEKRRTRHSENFNEMFSFFLKSYRHKILDFCGSEVITIFDKNKGDGKFCFKSFDNGIYSKEEISKGIKTKHPNILKGVIIGKKSWGLWKNEWSDGISEGSFTKKEILQQFEERNIKIPESLMLDFENTIYKKIMRRLSP